MKRILLLIILAIFSVFYSCSKEDIPAIDNPKIEKTKDEEAKEDEAKEDEAKEDETKEDETKEDETKEDETKEDETKEDETKEDETKEDETKEDEGKDEDDKDKDKDEDKDDKDKEEDDVVKKTELEKTIIGKWEVEKIKVILLWANIKKKPEDDVYMFFSEKGEYISKIDVKPEFSGQGTYKSTSHNSIEVKGNVSATISNIIFKNDNNTIEATIKNSDGQTATIRAVRMKLLPKQQH